MIIEDLGIMSSATLSIPDADLSGMDDGDGSVALLLPYLDPKFDSPAYLLRTRMIAGGLRRWWVGFDLEVFGKNERVKANLREKASSAGLYAKPDENMIPYTDEDTV